MRDNHNENKGKKSLILIFLTILFIGLGALLFVLKPMGDKFPFDDLMYKTSKTGLKYHIKKQGRGPRPKDTNMVTFSCDYRLKKSKKKLFDTKTADIKWPLKFDKSLIKENGGLASVLQEAASLMKKGGVISLQIPADVIFRNKDGNINLDTMRKFNMKRDSVLIFSMEVDDIQSQDDFMKVQEEKMKDKLKEIKARHDEEIGIIDSKLKSENIDLKKVKKLESGVKYMITKHKAAAERVKKGQLIEIEYTLKTLDGKMIGKPNSKITFKIGDNPPQVIPGWEEVLPKLRLGESAKMWVPSSSAYSIFGFGKAIRPNEILYYEVTVLDIFSSKNKR